MALSIIQVFLFYSCPYFRNEIGGEGERSVVLSRSKVYNVTTKNKSINNIPESSQPFNRPDNQQKEVQFVPNTNLLHMPVAARGFSLLDTPETKWKDGYCPYHSQSVVGDQIRNRHNVPIKNTIERVDEGALFYKNFFYGQGK